MPRKKQQKDFSYRPVISRLTRFNLLDKKSLKNHQMAPSIGDINTLNMIEKTYGFNNGDLIEYFLDLSIFTGQIQSTEKQIPRDCDKRVLLNELTPLIEDFLRIIKEDYAGSHRKELYEITKFYIYPENYNYLHHIKFALNFILDHLLCKSTRDKLGKYSTELISHAERLIDCLKRGGLQLHYDINGASNDYCYNEKSLLIDFIEEILIDLLARIKSVSLSYTTKTGRPYNAVKHNLIIKLMWIFEDGTKKPAQIYWYEYDEAYKGEFANFLKDCTPLLAKYFLSPSDTYESIARMAKDTIQYYKELDRGM